ncbi:hypothetical protein OSTOST_13559 [Ostertagia ostertagi]
MLQKFTLFCREGMLKKFVPSFRIVRQSFRLLSSESDGDDKKRPPGSAKDVLGDDLLDAVNAVVEDLHESDPTTKKATKNTLISKLMSHEKATFDEATGAQMQEMLDDKVIQGLLSSVAADAKPPSTVPNNLSHFKVAEESEKQQKVKRAEEEQRFYDYAYQMAELNDILGDGSKARKTIKPDPAVPSLLKGSKRAWNMEELRGIIMNQSLGPENSFEEQIEWTEQGKQWPYPIDNEYMLGHEAEVPFYEHVFLERHLAGLGLPKDGPIAHFMELVCVGLSKNPYMTIEKKMDHLKWFANFFNEEKQKLIKKLHEEEQLAAQQS